MPVPTYAAFLRAINLGAVRKFPKDAIKAAVEGPGMTDVETYINTGNVRFTTSMRSRAKIEAALEKAFKADRDFEVPTFVFTTAELVEIAETADELWAEHGEPRMHYVTLFKQAPAAAAGDRAARARTFRARPASSTAGPPTPCSPAGLQDSKLLSSRLFAEPRPGHLAQRHGHEGVGAEVGLTRSRRRTERRQQRAQRDRGVDDRRDDHHLAARRTSPRGGRR